MFTLYTHHNVMYIECKHDIMYVHEYMYPVPKWKNYALRHTATNVKSSFRLACIKHKPLNENKDCNSLP